MSIKLAERRTEAKVTGMPKSGIILLTGHPKSGKSWLGASAPNSLVVELEEGGGDRIPFGRIQDISGEGLLDQFDQAMEAAMEAKDIDTVVIDTVDQLGLLYQADIASKAGIEYIGKPKSGVDSRALWGEFSARMHLLTDNLRSCGKLAVLIAHSKPPEKDEAGRVISPAGINISGKSGQYIASHADAIGNVGVRVVAGRAQHYITFKSASDLSIWRSRIEEFHDREFILDKRDPWGSFVSQAFGAAKAAVKLAAPVKGKGGKK